MAANSWRPGSWQGRRDSSASRMGDAPPPPRPQAQRQMSTSEVSDPRRRLPSNDPRKRPPSQSPEPARPLKQPRSAHPSAPASPKDASSPRRSSVSNAPTRAGAPPGPTDQLKADLRRDAGGSMRSPASPFNGSGSGGSTPLHTSTTGRASGPLNITKVPESGHESGSTTNPILAALNSFGSQVATQASLELEQRSADRSYDRTCTEYKLQKKNFDRFPALHEKKKTARETAYKTKQQAMQQFEKHVTAQQDIMRNLAALIGSAAQAKPEAEARTDLVSRAEYETLTKKNEEIIQQYNALSTSLNAVQGRLKAEENAVVEVRRIANGAATTSASSLKLSSEASKAAEEARKSNAEVEKIARDANGVAANTSKSLSEVKLHADETREISAEIKRKAESAIRVANDARVETTEALRLAKGAKNISGQVSQFQGQIAQLASDVARLFEWKQENKEGVSRQSKDNRDRLEQTRADIETIRKDIALFKKEMSNQYALRKDVGELESSVDTLAQDVAGVRKANTSLAKDVQSIKSDQSTPKMNGTHAHPHSPNGLDTAYKSRVDQLWAHGIWKDAPKVVNSVDQLGKKLETLQQDVEAIKKTATSVPLSQASLEEGEIRSQQPQPDKRGQHGNLVARVPVLEQRYDSLRAEIDDLKSRVRVDSPSGHVTIEGDVDDRLKRIEEDLRSLHEMQDQKDDIILNDISEKDSKLRGALEDVSKQSKDETARLWKDYSETKTGIERIQTSMVTKDAFAYLEKVAIDPMRDNVHKLQTDVKDLQNHRARQASMPAPQTPTAPTMFGQTSQMPNGVHSPHINGPQRVPTPQGQGQPGLEVTRLKSQIDGVIMAQQHLKTRYDNLVTDEIVKQMAGQMSEMYPDAKNFNSAHKALSKRTDALEGEIRNLKQSNANRPGEMFALRTRVDGLEKALREANDLAKKMEQDVASVRNTTSALSRAKSASPAPVPAPATTVTPSQLDDVRQEVGKLGQIARAADLLSRGHATRFTNLDLTKKRMDEIGKMENVVKQHTGKLDDLDNQTKGLQRDVNEMAEATAHHKVELKELEEWKEEQDKEGKKKKKT